MPQDSVIRWLHLTDLHMGMGEQDWLWPSMKDRFHENLKKIYKEAGPWDLVLFTGDLAQRGSEDDYKQLEAQLGDVWSWFADLKCKPLLLAVPGNHDLNRSIEKRDRPTLNALERWFQEDEACKEIWDTADDNPYTCLLKKAFKHYTDWWERTAHRPQTGLENGLLPGDFSYTFQKGDLSLGIMGLNSSFLQLTSKNDYQGRLVIHPRQCTAVAPKKDHIKWARSHDTCFLMTHHPMEWIHSDCKKKFFQDAMGCFSLHLCGHQHETSVLQMLTGGAEHAPIHWVGRSLFGLEKAADGTIEREHGYVSAKLFRNGDDSGVQFQPIERREQDNDWELVPDHSVKLPDYQRTRVFPIRWFKKAVVQSVIENDSSGTTNNTERSSSFSDLILAEIRKTLSKESELGVVLSGLISKDQGTLDELSHHLLEMGFEEVWKYASEKEDAFTHCRIGLRQTLFLLAQAECKGEFLSELRKMREDDAPADAFIIPIYERYENLMALILDAALGTLKGTKSFKKRLVTPQEWGLDDGRLQLDVAKQLMRRLHMITGLEVEDADVQKKLSKLSQRLRARHVSGETFAVEHNNEKAIDIPYLVQFIFPSETREESEEEIVIKEITRSGDDFIDELLGIIMRRLDE